MTDEERQAIETMKHWIDYEKANKDKINKADKLIEIQETILNLIEKQQTEIRQYDKALHDQIIKDYDMELELKAEIEKKDKLIEEMVKINPYIYRMANMRLEEKEGSKDE